MLLRQAACPRCSFLVVRSFSEGWSGGGSGTNCEKWNLVEWGGNLGDNGYYERMSPCEPPGFDSVNLSKNAQTFCLSIFWWNSSDLTGTD